MSHTISGTTGSLRFQSQGSMDADGTLDGNPLNSMEANDGGPGGLVGRAEEAFEEVPF